MGKENMFGPYDQFGSHDQLGKVCSSCIKHEMVDVGWQNNEFGRGAMFGREIVFGKGEECGSRSSFVEPEHLQGHDEFGTRNWGLQESDLPKSDKEPWAVLSCSCSWLVLAHKLCSELLPLVQITNRKGRFKTRSHALSDVSSPLL